MQLRRVDKEYMQKFVKGPGEQALGRPRGRSQHISKKNVKKIV
jgi:hypothetical protein